MQGYIEFSKPNQTTGIPPGAEMEGGTTEAEPGTRLHCHSVAEEGPTDGSSCSSQDLMTVSELCKRQGPGEGRQPSAGEAAGSGASRTGNNHSSRPSWEMQPARSAGLSWEMVRKVGGRLAPAELWCRGKVSEQSGSGRLQKSKGAPHTWRTYPMWSPSSWEYVALSSALCH